MDRNAFMWVLECCLLAYDNVSKMQMLEFGCPEELAEMGIQLCSFLSHKELNVYNV
jgi:hypothetical protein